MTFPVLLLASVTAVACASPGRTDAPTAACAASHPTVATTGAATGNTSTDRWHTLAPAPASLTTFGMTTSAWTGRELLVTTLGKAGFHTAAYDPARCAWRTMPMPAPGTEPGMTQQAIWDGTEMLQFGVVNAALNPDSGTWRPLAPPPLDGLSTAVWTGQQVLMWAGDSGYYEDFDNSPDGDEDGVENVGAAYDPTHNTWQRLPAAPAGTSGATTVWTGTELLVIGHRGAAYNPSTRSWRQLPAIDTSGASVTWTGSVVLVVGGTHSDSNALATAEAYDPATNKVRHIAPMPSGRSLQSAVWDGNRLLVFGGLTVPAENAMGDFTDAGPGLAYDPRHDAWTLLPAAPIPGRTGAIAVWTGSQAIVWGGFSATADENWLADGAAYIPAT
ncbi:MAG TPA: hypothetical protein VKB69_08160 [Micromonosporaceae bacterium]|nr:hypothetical protein [Micromonosporaceae bacterium]